MKEEASEIFKQLATQGQKALTSIHSVSYSPKTQKTLRRWGILEVAEMVGRSAQYIRQTEKSKKLPTPTVLSKSNNRRSYTLADINNIRDIFKTRPNYNKKNDPAIIAFANFKGGAAKTTSAINAAQYFSKKGYRTLFIDCDSQASATQIFGYIPDKDIKIDETLLPYFSGEIKSVRPLIKKTYWDGLDLIPANLALYNVEFLLPTKIAEYTAQKKVYEFYNILGTGLKDISSDYDIIIIDCPPSMGMMSINAVFCANALIIPTPPAMLDFTSTVQFFTMIQETLQRVPNKIYKFIRIMITKHDGRASSDAIVSVLRKIYGEFVLTNCMYNTEVIKRASAKMQTLYEIEKYDGSKPAFNRAIQITDLLHAELETIIKLSWGTVDGNNVEERS